MKAVLPLLAAALLGCGAHKSVPKGETAVSAGVVTLTAATFPAMKAQDKPVLIDFWAPWCGPCRQQGPIVEQVGERAGDKAVVAKVNVDDERALAAQFGVQAIPTLVILKDGAVRERFVGVQSAETLTNALEAAAR
jgi:thioredoxin 1